MPSTPQKAAGWRIEPPVSVPRLSAARSAATTGEEAPEGPPGTGARSHGLRVVPKARCWVEEPIATWSLSSLPTRIAPAASSRATTVASYGGTKRSRIFEPEVVRTPRVQNRSLRAIGTPSSGPRGLPALKRASDSAARRSASSRVTVRKARSCGSMRSIRARYSVTARVGVAVPLRYRAASSCAVSDASMRPLLLDDLGDAEQVALAVRRVGERLGLGQRRIRHVVPHHVGDRHRVRGGLDAGGFQRAELVEVGQDAVELTAHPLLLGRRQVEPGQARHVLDVVGRDLRAGGGHR